MEFLSWLELGTRRGAFPYLPVIPQSPPLVELRQGSRPRRGDSKAMYDYLRVSHLEEDANGNST